MLMTKFFRRDFVLIVTALPTFRLPVVPVSRSIFELDSRYSLPLYLASPLFSYVSYCMWDMFVLFTLGSTLQFQHIL